MTTSTSADVKEIQGRNAAARGRVIAAGHDQAEAIEAAMMELAAIWREEAAHVTAAGRKGHIGIAKEYTMAAARLAGFAVGLTSRPISEPTNQGTYDIVSVADTTTEDAGPLTNAKRVSSIAEVWDDALEHLAIALPEDDPVAAVFSSPIGNNVGPSLPGDPGYREAEHGRRGAPCFECIDVANNEDPSPWCDCRDDETCAGPCRRMAHAPAFHGTPGDASIAERQRLLSDLAVRMDVASVELTAPLSEYLTTSEEQNLRDIIGSLGVTATIDHPFTNPGIPWLNQRRSVEVIPYAELPIIAAALPPRGHVSHSYVETYEGCSLSAMLRDASRASHVGASRPGWSQLGGKAFHAAVELIERLALSGVTTADDPETLWNQHFDAVVQEQLDALVGTPYADSATWYISNRGKEGFDWWRVEGAKMLGLYVKHHTPAWRANNPTFLLQDTTPVIELEYSMSIRSLDGERGLTAQGFVDRATLDLTTYSLTVLDYKTGSREPESTFQLGEYGHALLMAMGIAAEPADRPILGRYWLARKGIYTDAVPVVTRHPLAELQYRYDAAARGTQARIFAPHVTNLCKSCSVVDYCPAQAGRS